jgi:glycosyltransferase involved in cell wall biosynthesis
MGSSTRPSVAFILSKFPCYDEPFFVRDMKAVAEAGLRVTIFSIKPCRDPIVHAEAERMLRLRIHIPLWLSWRVWVALLFALVMRFPRFLRGLIELVRHSWGSLDFLAKSLLLVPQACAYAREVENRGIGHIHALWATHPATMALFIHRLTGIRWSFSGHAHDVYTDITGLTYKMERAAFVVTSAAATRDHLIGLRPQISPDRVHVVYHGLDFERQYSPRITGPKEPPLRIVSVGSLLPCKGFDRLLRAVRILLDQRVPVHLTIVGGGPLERELRQLADKLGVAGVVHFTGYQTQEEMPLHYQAAHCFVLAAVPEIHWGIPNVVLEALGCALPVVTTELPAISEIVDGGVSGLLLPEPTPELIAERLAVLAGNPHLRHTIGMEGRRRVRRLFNVQRAAARWKALILGEDPHRACGGSDTNDGVVQSAICADP